MIALSASSQPPQTPPPRDRRPNWISRRVANYSRVGGDSSLLAARRPAVVHSHRKLPPLPHACRPDLANSFWRGVRTYTCIHAGIGYMIRPACPEHDRSVGIYIIATRSRPAGHGPSDLDGYCVRRAVPDRVRHACRPSMQMDCRRWLRAPEMRDMI